MGPRPVAHRRSVPGTCRDRTIRFDDRCTGRPDGQRRSQGNARHRGTGRSMNIDPVTIEVVASRLREAASTMEHALYHSGYSPILRESKDGTAGLTDKAGRVVMLSGGIQFHYTAYEQSVQGLLARYPLDRLRPGDSFVLNDPYKGGLPHASDYCAITPAFHRGELIGFGVSVAHKSDIGGS